ncbi:hypothetical protein [Streptomyces sp. NRRL S-87]|uniref:hypothetical protein n=1 Tax=Streptomyces sp. NRRL S-87 TaxID=1463920 RepID=UPI0004C11073|nr:hypothetical protein [Streptomyces sp. NRRL S-87]
MGTHRTVRIVGSAVLGAVLGAAGLAAVRWGQQTGDRVCESSPDEFCLTLYPFEGMALWLALTLVGFWIGLWALRVRPLGLSVPACVLTGVLVQMVWAQYVGLGWSGPHAAVCAAGPALLAAVLPARRG